MMDYNLFKEKVVEQLETSLPPMFADYHPRIDTVRKVNEEKDALILHPPHRSNAIALPTVYLDDMYAMFKESEDFHAVMEEILNIIVWFTGFPLPGIESLDFREMQDKLIINLINTEKNREMLRNVPHRDFLDLSIIYRFIMCEEDDGFGTIVLTNDIMESMGCTPEEIHEAACTNTQQILPATITEPVEGFFLMSNKRSLGGAATIVCNECMDKLASRIGEDFFIIPGSIHEIYAVAANGHSVKDLICMLEEGNRLYVAESEQLSKSIYKYDYATKEISIAGSYVAM